MRVGLSQADEHWLEVDRLIRDYLHALPFEVDFQDLDRELADLRSEYGPPAGAALLVHDDAGAAVGFAGVRRFDASDAELKRMYVVPAVRGAGIGCALATAAVDAARSLGYERLLLDSVDSMASALSIYAALGFTDIPPYRHNPLLGARYLALDLREQGAPSAGRVGDEH